MKYNHNRELASFEPELAEIRKAGFNPIAVTQMYFDDTFVFETYGEAFLAYCNVECELKTVDGRWLDKENFLKRVAEYEKNSESKVRIYWLNENKL